jgi:hypothetical protein
VISEKIPTPIIYENETVSEKNFKAIIKDYVVGKTLYQYIKDYRIPCEEIPDRRELDYLLNSLFKPIERFLGQGRGNIIYDPHSNNIMYVEKRKWVIVDGNLWDGDRYNEKILENYLKYLVFNLYSEQLYNLFQRCDITAGALLMKIRNEVQTKFGGVPGLGSGVRKYRENSRTIRSMRPYFRSGECLINEYKEILRIEEVWDESISVYLVDKNIRNKSRTPRPFELDKEAASDFEKIPCP